jgi:hypothetical protein
MTESDQPGPARSAPEADADPETGIDGDSGPDAGFRAITGAARDAWRDERVEVVAAILLSLATVLSAWGAYQATRWGGNQANSYAAAATYRAEAASHNTVASRQIQIDVATFLAWSDAALGGDEQLAKYIEDRFRPEFLVAFEAWLGERPPNVQLIPLGTPFAQPEYVLAEQVATDAAQMKAEEASADARYANQISDNFVLTAVLFASVLFFAGIAAKFRPQWIRWAMLSIALLVFVIGLIVEFSLPQNVGF